MTYEEIKCYILEHGDVTLEDGRKYSITKLFLRDGELIVNYSGWSGKFVNANLITRNKFIHQITKQKGQE